MSARDPVQPDVEPTGKGSRQVEEAAVFALLYEELRAVAHAELRKERRGHTLNATALVNEAFVKLTAPDPDTRKGEGLSELARLDRHRFLGMAATAMRRILVDYARMKGRKKRGGAGNVDRAAKSSSDLVGVAAAPDAPDTFFDVVELNDALTRLADEHPDAARVTELRFFGGLPETTIAELMQINERTVRRHWTFAKAWLARELEHTQA